MPADDIPEDVREFIFEYIDSIEQLDVMLLLRSTRERSWTPQQVSAELRTNSDSTGNRLTLLKAMGILESDDESPPSYRFKPATPEIDEVIHKLAETFRIRRHKVYGLIFSSLKRARKFLNAFTVPDKERGK